MCVLKDITTQQKTSNYLDRCFLLRDLHSTKTVCITYIIIVLISLCNFIYCIIHKKLDRVQHLPSPSPLLLRVSPDLSLRLSHLKLTSLMFNVLSSAWLCCIITVYVLLYFRNTGDENISCDSLDRFGRIRMPLWLNMRSNDALNAGTDNAWTSTKTWFCVDGLVRVPDKQVWGRQNWNRVQTRVLEVCIHVKTNRSNTLKCVHIHVKDARQMNMHKKLSYPIRNSSRFLTPH